TLPLLLLLPPQPPLTSFSPLFFILPPPPPRSTLFPYTTLFRSHPGAARLARPRPGGKGAPGRRGLVGGDDPARLPARRRRRLLRSEEHTSELQSRFDLVCRLLLEKKKRKE